MILLSSTASIIWMPALELAISPRSLDSFHWRMVGGNQDWGAGRACCCCIYTFSVEWAKSSIHTWEQCTHMCCKYVCWSTYRYTNQCIGTHICKTNSFVTLCIPSRMLTYILDFFHIVKFTAHGLWQVHSHGSTTSVLYKQFHHPKNSHLYPALQLFTSAFTTTYLFHSYTFAFSRISYKRWIRTICSLLSLASFA